MADWQRSLFADAKVSGNAHMFRHTVATGLLTRGVPIEDVAILLGHASPAITAKYYPHFVQARRERLEERVRGLWASPIHGPSCAQRWARRAEAAVSRLSHPTMHAHGHGFWNSQRPVDAPPRTLIVEDDHTRLIEEQAAHEVIAHIPALGQLLDGIMVLEGRLLRWHVPSVSLVSAGWLRGRSDHFSIAWRPFVDINYDSTMRARTSPNAPMTPTVQPVLDKAGASAWGLSGVMSASGQLERPVEPNLLLVPGLVDLDNDRLVWQHDPASVTAPGSGFLEAFVRLADGPNERIRDYARRWGVLGICAHDLPRTHDWRMMRSVEANCLPRGYRISEDRLNLSTGWEPLAVWRRYASQARAILDIAASLHQGHAVRDEESWKQAGRRYSGDDRDGDLVQRQCGQISVEVNGWLELGHVLPLFSWGGTGPALVTLGARVAWFNRESQAEWLPSMCLLQGTSLFGALAVQLLMAVSRTGGLAICSGCGAPYVPKRRPNPQRRRYCPDCGLKAAWRDAQAVRRRRTTGGAKAQ